MKKLVWVLGILVIVSLIVQVSALDEERQDRLDFGYVLVVKDIYTKPSYIVPGNDGLLIVKIENKANFPIFDIRVDVNLSDEIAFFHDVSKRRISRIEAGEQITLKFKIVPLPTTSEGIYEATTDIYYINHVATERQETDTFGIVVKADPKIFAQVEKSEIYQGKNTGKVTVKFINNEVADIKFLTVELLDTEDYKILSPSIEYIGDLDSDDFESVDFNLALDTKESSVNLPLKISYKDSLNNDYSEELSVQLDILTADEFGVKSNGKYTIAIVVIIVLIIIYFVYRRWKRKKRRDRY